MTTQGLARMMLLALVVVIVSQTALRAAEPVEQKVNDQFTLKLIDGSSLVCKPKLESLPFKTSFAEMSIPLQKVETIKIDHKEKLFTISLLNKDRIQGKCALETLTVTSLLGELKIPLASIEEITTALKTEPVFDDTPGRANTCINNLKQIEGAKDQWALASKKAVGDQAIIAEVNQYLKSGSTPICPSGGKYLYNSVGNNAKCSVPRHVISD